MNKEERIDYLRYQQICKSSELESSKQNVSLIDEKLSRLNCAKKSVDNIFQEMKKLRKETYAIRDKEEWKGSNKDSFMKEMDNFNHNFKQYVSDLNSYYDEICNTITKLENQKLSEESIIGGLMSLINSIGNEIEKLIHF